MQTFWNANEVPVEVKETLKPKPGEGCGSYHAACAARHLENHYNEAGRLLIQKSLIEKSNNKN